MKLNMLTRSLKSGGPSFFGTSPRIDLNLRYKLTTHSSYRTNSALWVSSERRSAANATLRGLAAVGVMALRGDIIYLYPLFVHSK